jgi:V/A-type H+-transporting ATPase subunit C
MNAYHYGAGRVRALEARMLSPTQLSRMAAASDFGKAFAVLSETTYAENFPKLKHPFDFEELCGLELSSLKDLLDRLAPGNEILAALFKKYDYLNLKILLRSYFGQKEEFEIYSSAGTIDFIRLKYYIFEGIKEIDDKELLKVVDEAKTSYEQNKDPQSLDVLLDKHYFSYLKEVCSTSPSPLIRNLANHKIDLINIKTLLRVQELKKDKKFLGATLLEPGFVDKDILLNLHDKSAQDIISKLSFTPYLPSLAEGFEQFLKEKSFYLLEKLMDDFIIEQFRKAKYLSSGVEPLVGFYLAKEAEIKTLRFILICKKNYVQTERIKERMRVSYV